MGMQFVIIVVVLLLGGILLALIRLNSLLRRELGHDRLACLPEINSSLLELAGSHHLAGVGRDGQAHEIMRHLDQIEVQTSLLREAIENHSK